MFIELLLIVAKYWKLLKHPSAGTWMNILWYNTNLLSNKKERLLTCNALNEPQGHYA